MVKVTKRIAEQRLGQVAEDKQFWCQNGRTLRDLAEFEAALRDMDDNTFSHHTSEARNDFSIWVRDVIGDGKLANDLRKSKTRVQAVKSVADRITWLKSKIREG